MQIITYFCGISLCDFVVSNKMRFEILESKMAYITRGKSSVCYTPRVSFFEESFRVPKILLINPHWNERILLVRIPLRVLHHYLYS